MYANATMNDSIEFIGLEIFRDVKYFRRLMNAGLPGFVSLILHTNWCQPAATKKT